jgi:hypothetical protein
VTLTFADRLTGPEGRDLRLYLTIDGIADVMQEDVVDVPSTFETSTRTRRRVVQTIEHGQSEIDLHARRMVGGSLRVVLLDDVNETLADLFAARARRSAYVTSTTTATATTINVNDATPFSALGGTVYIGGETITFTGTTATTLTGCTRGAFGSTAQRHYGGTDQGAGVFTAPPRWVGRRVRLYGYFLDDDGTTTTSLRQQLDTFRLEESPAYLGQGRWELRCSHLSDEIAQRKLGQGLHPIKLRPVAYTLASGNFTFQTEGFTGLFKATAGSWPTWCAIKFQGDDGVAILRFVSAADAVNVTNVTTSADNNVGNLGMVDTFEGRLRGSTPSEMRHITVLQGGALSTLALFALTSVIGDGTNGAYDVLPGTTRDSGIGGEEFHFGAGIPIGEVNTASFIALDAGHANWSYVIDETIGLDDFLRDLCLVTESYWIVDATGALVLKRVAETAVASSLTIGDSVVIGEPTVEMLEDVIFPRARIECGYDTTTGEYLDSVTVIDVEMAGRYPERGDTLELQTRALSLSPTGIARPRCSLADLETIARRAMVADGRGRLYVTLNATLAALTLDLGATVTIGVDLPDFEGGTLSGRTARIVSRRPRYDDGVVELRLQVTDTLYFISPAAVIASSVGATLTLRTTGPEVSSTSPANQFVAGMQLELVHVSPFSIETVTVQSVTAPATMVLTGAPATAVTAGSDYIRLQPNGTTQPGIPTANGFLASNFIWQQATGDTTGTRWR